MNWDYFDITLMMLSLCLFLAIGEDGRQQCHSALQPQRILFGEGYHVVLPA